MGDETPTAILTKGQREYLRGEREPTQERTMKTRIRQRLREGVKDLDLILRHMDPVEIQKALKLRGSDRDERTEDLKTQRGLASAVGVVYLASLAREESHFGRDDPEGWKFDEYASDGIEVALNRLGIAGSDVTISRDIEYGQTFDEIDDLDSTELGELSLDELFFAKKTSAITEEQFDRAMEQKYGGE